MYFLPCGKIILQIRNSVSPQISYPQIEYSLNSREVYGLASNRPVKKVAMRVVADEKDHRKLHLTLNVIQCMKVISGTNRKTDLRQNIQPKTESRSMKISPESHKYKPRPNKNKSTTIIGLYILQWYPVMKTSHARKCPFMPIRHRNTRGITEIFATDEDAHDISPFNGGNSDGIYGAAGFLYHMQIIPNWK